MAKTAIGTQYKIGDGATPTEVFTTIPEITTLDVPDVNLEMLDVTSHDSTGGFREFLPGLRDGATVSAEMNWDPTDTIHQQVRTDAYAATVRNFKQVFPGTGTGLTCEFSGYIQQFKPTASAGQALKATMQNKVSGMPTWS